MRLCWYESVCKRKGVVDCFERINEEEGKRGGRVVEVEVKESDGDAKRGLEGRWMGGVGVLI